MKRVKNKIVKIFSSIGLALFTFGTKVKAVSFDSVLYGPPNQDLYGVFDSEPEPLFWDKALPIIQKLFIPLILIIGLLIYLKKSKDKKNNKIFLVIAVMLLVAIILWLEFK